MEMDVVLYELSQCREDERASKAQIFQILAAVASFLAVLTAILGLINSVDPGKIENFSVISIFIYLLAILVACSAVAYISNLGMLSVFRHYYIVDMESWLSTQFSENNHSSLKIRWETLSKSLITLNPKHIGSGLFLLFPINYHIYIISILTLGIIFISMQMYFILQSFPQFEKLLWAFLYVFIAVLLICGVTLLVSLGYMKKLYLESLEKALKHNWKEHKAGYIFYYLYPRIKDIQKIVFLVLGWAVGLCIRCQATNISFAITLPDICILLIAILVIDGLIYQARYLWNDIRGAGEDQNHPLSRNRCRLPVQALGFRPAIQIAIAVIILRLTIAGICIVFIQPSLMIPSLFILLLGVCYEIARTKENPKMTIFLVGLGYPLRLFAGAISVFPSLNSLWQNDLPTFIVLLLTLFAAWAFGESFVSMTWVLEGAYILQNPFTEAQKDFLRPYLKQAVKNKYVFNFYPTNTSDYPSQLKPHLAYLMKKMDDSQRMEKYPLKNLSSISLWWNISILLSSISLQFTALLFPGHENTEKYPFVLVAELTQVLYLVIYFMFRSSNYIELYQTLDHLITWLHIIFKKLCCQILALFLGKNTAQILISNTKNNL